MQCGTSITEDTAVVQGGIGCGKIGREPRGNGLGGLVSGAGSHGKSCCSVACYRKSTIGKGTGVDGETVIDNNTSSRGGGVACFINNEVMVSGSFNRLCRGSTIGNRVGRIGGTG